MIFDKILDYMNLNNWVDGKYHAPNKNTSHNTFSSKHFSPMSVKEFNHLSVIKNYWESNPYTYASRSYREPSFAEIQEFAKAIVLSGFESARTPDSFSNNILFQLRITNWNNYFSVLFKDGYIRKANTLETLNSCTLQELKSTAEHLSIKKTGKKSELSQRIYDTLSNEQKKRILSSKNFFILTEKGTNYLLSQSDYVLLWKHKNYNISLSEFNDKRIPDGFHKRSFYDTMFQVLTERIFYYECSKSYDILSIEYLHVYEIMFEEFTKTDAAVPLDVALSYYIEYLYLMTCFPRFATFGANGIYAHNFDYIQLPKIPTDILKLSDYKGLINFNVIFSNKPPSFLYQEEFISYVNEIFDSSMFDSQKWNQKVQARLYYYSQL